MTSHDHDDKHARTCSICRGAGWIDRPLTLAENEYASRWAARDGDRPWVDLSPADRSHFRVAVENETDAVRAERFPAPAEDSPLLRAYEAQERVMLDLEEHGFPELADHARGTLEQIRERLTDDERTMVEGR